ncbi:hypothetical protein [Ottowia thiooxydans]|uniref:hypothetical protein n=1 Tax=Ottowia thiooxydans TaxID=219182 RepID=UPI000428D35B|nr:hypothetical protein [Ottowia thiooxydans]
MSVSYPSGKSRFPSSLLRTGMALVVAFTLVACGGEDDPPWKGMDWVEGVGWVAPGGTSGYSWVEGQGWVYWAASGGVGSGPGAGSQAVACKDYDGNPMMVNPKTITINNNSDIETIYPVVATSSNEVNEWVQACLRTTEPYPTKLVYKLYVNEGKGIPPGSSATITLPLYSEISAGNYITWWNGGRMMLADKNDQLRNKDDTKVDTPASVSCYGEGVGCDLTTYSSTNQFPENIYGQLSEFTFGDSILTAGQSTRLLKPENVGYNISYVDHVYMPVAIAPRGNPYIGYSGSVQPAAQFRSKLEEFLGVNGSASPALGQGWPVYNLHKVKLPGGYNIFAQRTGTLHPDDDVPVKPSGTNPPVLTVWSCMQGQCTDAEKKSLRYGEAVQRIQNLWGSCVSWDGENISGYVTEQVVCPQEMKDKMTAIKQFFMENHKNYLKITADGQCKSKTPVKPSFNYWEAMMHIYGWVPFNEGCNANLNALAGTSIPGWDHSKLQSMYINDMQYNYQQAEVIANPKLTFNPYVKLIHDGLQMNAYGFSVDDAVGFMSELGDGLVFTVGGPRGLENQKQFNDADGFSVAIGVPAILDGRANKPLIKKYGVCSLNQSASDPNCLDDKQDVFMPGNSQIAGFKVGSVESYPVKVRFTDVDDNVYTFIVKEKFAACTQSMPVSACPSNKPSIFDKQDPQTCSVTNSKGETHAKSHDWCVNANPNQQREKQLTKNYLSFPVPVGYAL